MSPKEFKVNEYITLKLEEKDTFLYVNNERFDQCKFLLLRQIKIDEISNFSSKFSSVDEESQYLDHSNEDSENQKNKISPETEFWAHCSNLQAWAENHYDSRLLHRNLAFPLLKKLMELGDLNARKVFKDEITKRIKSGFEPVILYLINEGYLNYFKNEEFDTLIESIKNVEILTLLESIFNKKLQIYKEIKIIERLVELNPEDQYRLEKLKDIYSVVEKYKKYNNLN